MFQRRYFATAIAILFVLSVLAGCTSNSTDSSKSSSSSSDVVELKVWLTPQWKGVLDASEDGADYDSFFKHAGSVLLLSIRSITLR